MSPSPSGSTRRLTKDDKEQLDSFAATGQSPKSYILEVTGGTDSTGSAEYNYALSQRRADAVVQYLASKYKVPAHRFYLIGIGKDKEVAPNDTAEGRKQNRRVEVACCRHGGQQNAATPDRSRIGHCKLDRLSYITYIINRLYRLSPVRAMAPDANRGHVLCGQDLRLILQPSWRMCSARTSSAVNRRRNGAPWAAASTAGRPLASSRSTMQTTATTSMPASRAASIAVMVEAPVVHTSSTITTRAPSRQKPSIRRPVPCAFSALRTRKPWSRGAAGCDCARHALAVHVGNDGIGAQRQAAYCVRLDAVLFEEFENGMPGEATAFSVQGGGAAIDIVVAGGAGGKLELAETETGAGKKREQLLCVSWLGHRDDCRDRGNKVPREHPARTLRRAAPGAFQV